MQFIWIPPSLLSCLQCPVWKISCKLIKLPNDGSEDALLPFLTWLGICQQNEGSALATYITINGDVEEDIIKSSHWWSASTDNFSIYMLDHQMYNSCLSSILLFGSMTEDITNTVLQWILHTLCNDGTILLWTICHHICHNDVAFNKTKSLWLWHGTIFDFH